MACVICVIDCPQRIPRGRSAYWGKVRALHLSDHETEGRVTYIKDSVVEITVLKGRYSVEHSDGVESICDFEGYGRYVACCIAAGTVSVSMKIGLDWLVRRIGEA